MSEPVLRFLSALMPLVGTTEEGGPNCGQMVERMLKKVGQTKGAPWCAAAVNFAGWHCFAAPDDQRSTWPVTMTAGCKAIGEWAERRGVLRDEGAVGQLFLMYFPTLKRFAHVGVLLAPLGGHQWLTWEGNTSDVTGSREGYKVCLRKRVIDPAKQHRFVDWVATLEGA